MWFILFDCLRQLNTGNTDDADWTDLNGYFVKVNNCASQQFSIRNLIGKYGLH